MSTVTISTTYYTPGRLTIEPVTCGSCGIAFGLESTFKEGRLSDGKVFYCPMGHRISWSETTEDQLKRQLKAERDHIARLNAERDQIEASRRAFKGQATRLRNRAIAGQCPICGQSLHDLARHIRRVHPDEQPEQEA